MNRRAALIIAFFLFAGSTVFVHASSVQAFTDISADYWGQPYISFASESGIVKGYPMEDGSFKFRPDNSVSKEESMQMLYKAATNSGIGPSFSEDLTAKYESRLKEAGIAYWAFECVSYGLENGILEEAELTGFRTGAGDPVPAIREEIARWTGKAIGKKLMPAIALDYADSDRIAAENKPYVDLLNRMKIMIGDDTGKFNPKSPIRRVEFAVICNRVYALSKAEFDIDAESRSLQGTISSVNSSDRNIYLSICSLGENSAKIIHLEDNIQIVINGKLSYNDLSSIPIGKKAVLAWGPYGQLHISTEVVVSKAVIGSLTPLSKECTEAELILGRGDRVYYYISGETFVIDKLMEGQGVIFIADGIKIVEIANTDNSMI
ncbi:MAG TPA: S-layer homology domain-containing protein [Bacillota bacterium]|jgi:hypothetical protein|nr:S-layer homology domain-containing protein [Bacillota bacterium]